MPDQVTTNAVPQCNTEALCALLSVPVHSDWSFLSTESGLPSPGAGLSQVFTAVLFCLLSHTVPKHDHGAKEAVGV